MVCMNLSYYPSPLLPILPNVKTKYVDNQQHSHYMTEARPRKQAGNAGGYVDNRWLSTGGEGEVAPHLTVVWFACNENGGPGILLLVRSPTILGGHKHGLHNDILPQCGVPRQRTNRPGQHWHPLVQGQALYLHGVPQDVQRHERHGLLSPADLCGDGEPGGDAAGPRVSTPSDRRSVWL